MQLHTYIFGLTLVLINFVGNPHTISVIKRNPYAFSSHTLFNNHYSNVMVLFLSFYVFLFLNFLMFTRVQKLYLTYLCLTKYKF